MKKMIKALSLALILMPAVAFAQLTDTKDIIFETGRIIDGLIILAAGAGLLVFLYGLAKFILAVGGDEKAVSQGKTLMIWGVVALFVMFSVWGLVRFIQGELGITNNDDIRIPAFEAY